MENMIFKRTSVRSYTSEKITSEEIELLMKAAMAAPSGCNAQPWEFIVVQKREILDKIMQVHPFSTMLKEAPLAIVVCSNNDKRPQFVPHVQLWPQDCSAATENILLQAAEMGLGGVWLGVHPRYELQKPLSEVLNLPNNIIPFSIISIGHPKGEVKPKDKFDKTKIHYDTWEEK